MPVISFSVTELSCNINFEEGWPTDKALALQASLCGFNSHPFYHYLGNIMYFFTDVEANGPCPGLYSMSKVGCVVLLPNGDTSNRFYGTFKPISDKFLPEAYEHSNVTREEHLTFDDPQVTMIKFKEFINNNTYAGRRPIFISDNLAFDWQFVNYYFHLYELGNPFGFSGRRINDIYSGAVKDLKASNYWKKFRITVHDHNPVNDALGNAEAFLEFTKRYSINYG